jgi:diguanylate cyclase (GGDEF)-like protein
MTVGGDAQSVLLLDLATALAGEPLSLQRVLDLVGQWLREDCGIVAATLYAADGRGRDAVPLASWGAASDRPDVAAALLSDTPSPAPGLLVLRRRGRTLGALVLTGSRLERLRSDVAVALALYFADELHALEQDREREFLTNAGAATRRLFEEGSVATSVEEAGAILAQVTAELFGTERAGVHLVDEHGRICYTVGVGATEQMSQALSRSLVGKFARDSPVWRTAEETGGPVLVEDVKESAVRVGGFAQTLEIRSYLAMPLLSASGIVGMAMCGDHTRVRRWSAADREMARHLALQGALVVDGARLRQAERSHLAEMTHHAFHDGLTGLPNRTLLMDRLDRLVAADGRGPGALLLLDLNGFKSVNDRLGHQAGDMLLDQVAQRLRGLIGDAGTAARLGGDEFAILVAGAPAVAQAVAARVHERLGQPFSLDGEPVRIGASVGIALYPEHAKNAPDLLRRADSAMYHAKRHHTGPQLYDSRRQPIDLAPRLIAS